LQTDFGHLMMSVDDQLEKNITLQNQPDSTNIRSLKDLIEVVAGKNITSFDPQLDSGLAEPIFYPFLAIVGQYEMKLALILTLINPNIGGVLLIGPRGTGKTTSIRGLIDILPFVENSTCQLGCLPEEIKYFGFDAVCPDCAQKFANNQPISEFSKVKIIELPLNTKLENVLGIVEDNDPKKKNNHLKRGVLSLADRNILYIDEVNLMQNEIINSILDAAAMGKYTTRQGSFASTFRSRFTLIGSMNPEEGNLRPQIMDRFGLRVISSGLEKNEERLEAYLRTSQYLNNPFEYFKSFENENILARQEIEKARKFVWKVKIDPQIAKYGIDLIKQLRIHSLRAEITLFEAAKALAASEEREQISLDDIQTIAPMALRLRRSQFITNFLSSSEDENLEIRTAMEKVLG